MNRREMLAAGIRRLARVLPGLAPGKRPGLGAGGRKTPPRRDALSFPARRPAPADSPIKPLQED